MRWLLLATLLLCGCKWLDATKTATDMEACGKMCSPGKVFKYENDNCYCLSQLAFSPDAR